MVAKHSEEKRVGAAQLMDFGLSQPDDFESSRRAGWRRRRRSTADLRQRRCAGQNVRACGAKQNRRQIELAIVNGEFHAGRPGTR